MAKLEVRLYIDDKGSSIIKLGYGSTLPKGVLPSDLVGIKTTGQVKQLAEKLGVSNSDISGEAQITVDLKGYGSGRRYLYKQGYTGMSGIVKMATEGRTVKNTISSESSKKLSEINKALQVNSLMSQAISILPTSATGFYVELFTRELPRYIAALKKFISLGSSYPEYRSEVDRANKLISLVNGFDKKSPEQQKKIISDFCRDSSILKDKVTLSSGAFSNQSKYNSVLTQLIEDIGKRYGFRVYNSPVFGW